MASGKRGGCTFLPLLVIFIAVALFFGRGEDAPVSGEASPRRPEVVMRPAPADESPPSWEVAIDDSAKPQDSQGTGFAIAPDGLWVTAEHVVAGCDRMGLATAADRAAEFRRVYQSPDSDIAVIADGLFARDTLPLARALPKPGDDGYHMGFPSGRPAVIHGKLMGELNAIRKSGRNEPVFAWAEQSRMPDFDHGLGGISGGPTLNAAGEVVGVNSASSQRRGRVLTTHPRALDSLLAATGARPAAPRAAPIGMPRVALMRFESLIAQGAVRPIYCDVYD